MKITKLKEIYVVVVPLPAMTPDGAEWQAEQALQQIKRHIDFESAYIERRTEAICSHCGIG